MPCPATRPIDGSPVRVGRVDDLAVVAGCSIGDRYGKEFAVRAIERGECLGNDSATVGLEFDDMLTDFPVRHLLIDHPQTQIAALELVVVFVVDPVILVEN